MTMERLDDRQDVHVPQGMIAGSLLLSAVAIGFLFWLIYGQKAEASLDVSYLAALNATLNASSACCLFLGYRAIRQGDWKRHRNLMLGALLFSALFLVSYIIYHTFHGDSRFLGTGLVRPIYFFILISHIVLSAVALPMILVTVGLSFTKRFQPHKKWARFTFPIWAYVSVTGVVIFFMLKIFGSA